MCGESAFHRDVGSEPYLSDVVARVGQLDTTPDAAQSHALMLYASAVFRSFEDSFMQFRAGTLDRAAWQTDETAVRGLMALAGFRAAWRVQRTLMSGAFVAQMDGIMRQVRSR